MNNVKKQINDKSCHRCKNTNKKELIEEIFWESDKTYFECQNRKMCKKYKKLWKRNLPLEEKKKRRKQVVLTICKILLILPIFFFFIDDFEELSIQEIMLIYIIIIFPTLIIAIILIFLLHL